MRSNARRPLDNWYKLAGLDSDWITPDGFPLPELAGVTSDKDIKDLVKAVRNKLPSVPSFLTKGEKKMEEYDDVGILLKDKQGAKISNIVMGALFGSDCNVLRGELVIKIPEKPRKEGQPPHNYQTVYTDQPATFYDETDVAPLLGNQHLLAAVKSNAERYQLFVSAKMEWGSTLKINDPVQVSLKHPQPTDTAATLKATAVIHYVGPVTGVTGIMFGIEIVDPHFFGQGTTDGTFQGERYFTCKDGNGMFVSLDKLSQLPPGGHVPEVPPRPPKQQPAAKSGGKHKKKDYRFKVEDRVVAFNKDGVPIHGTVRWVGPYSVLDETKQPFTIAAVGIETDVKVLGSEMESCLPPKHHYFSIGKNKGNLFIREEEVMLETDFVADTQPSPAPQPSPATQPTHQSPKPRRPLTNHPHGQQQHVDHTHPSQAPDKSLDVGDRRKLAEQLGVGSPTRLMKEQSELLQKAAEEKQCQELKEALAGESLNMQQQKERMRQFSEEKKKEDVRRISVSRKDMRDVNHIYDEVQCPSSQQKASSTGQPQPQGHPPAQGREPHPNQGWPPSSQPQPPVQHSGGYNTPQQHNRDMNPPLQQVIHHPAVSSGGSVPHHEPAPPHLGQNVAYANFPGTDSSVAPANLGIDSPVQLIQDASRTGVIRWMGTLPEAKGVVAGVELDAPMEGCHDGEWNGHRYFACIPGRAFFCPVASLLPDPRIPQQKQTFENPMQVPDWEEEDQHIQGNEMMKYIGEWKGIQGHLNSCYLDATIFGMFALSDVFDSLFLENVNLSLTSLKSPVPESPSVSETPAQQVQRDIGSMLWRGIVNPLRKNGAVRYESVMRLRNKLDELGKMEGVNTAEKDPEEFLNMLFKHTLHVDPFIQIERPFGTEPEFFIQLFVEPDKSLKVPTIEILLKKMFKEQQISFAEVPSKLLVQVPRYGKEFQTYKRIIPGIKLDPNPEKDCPSDTICFICGKLAKYICEVCKTEFHGKDSTGTNFCDSCNELVHSHKQRKKHKPEQHKEPEGVDLELLSVLCIETSHYVCFSRDPEEGRWLFFDSMADRVYDQFNIPRGVDCTAQLNEWVYKGDPERLMAARPRDLPELVRRFTQDVYMCVYIQPDFGMYG